MALSGLHSTDYETALKTFITSKEGSKAQVYTDGVGVPTIGAGYALTINKNWTADFATAGITPTAAQQTALQALISESDAYLKDTTLTTAQKETQVKALVTTYNASSNAISLTSTQVGDLFLTIKGTYEAIVKSKLGTTLYNSMANTKELVALVDLAYNGGGGLFGAGLVNALKNNDRAEAWFQMRYQSNGGISYQTVGTGMAERRIAESNLFDLYPTDANENYYKQVMQMYAVRKDIIYAVEHSTFKPSGNSEPIKSAYENDGLIEAKLSPAKDYLVSHYAQGVNIDGSIIVGQGIGNIPENYADGVENQNDILAGTSSNDLIFGERGDDTLSGGAGSDVLYGGDDNDVLMGNDGYGSADTESDILDGGAGYDTYVVGNNDIIYDSDGSGIIIFEGKVLKGVDVTMDSTIYPSNQDHTTYYSKEDEGTYTRNGNSGFTFLSDNGYLLTVYTPLDYTEKIIPKPGGGTMREKTYRGVGVTLENFSSPLVLDLNNDGITSLDLYASPAYFDMEGDGIREKTGWIQTTDALLAFDKNRDGIINDGSELFGNYTTLSNGMKADNGFEALAKYDNNHDGVIDKNDSAYNALSAWIDSNQDGITDDGELHSLSELGVTSISLNAIQINGIDISIYLKDGSKKTQSIFTYKELVA